MLFRVLSIEYSVRSTPYRKHSAWSIQNSLSGFYVSGSPAAHFFFSSLFLFFSFFSSFFLLSLFPAKCRRLSVSVKPAFQHSHIPSGSESCMSDCFYGDPGFCKTKTPYSLLPTSTAHLHLVRSIVKYLSEPHTSSIQRYNSHICVFRATLSNFHLLFLSHCPYCPTVRTEYCRYRGTVRTTWTTQHIGSVDIKVPSVQTIEFM